MSIFNFILKRTQVFVVLVRLQCDLYVMVVPNNLFN